MQEMLRGHVVFQGCDCEVGRKGRKNTPGRRNSSGKGRELAENTVGIAHPMVHHLAVKSGKCRHGSSSLWAHVGENQRVIL